MLTQLEGRTAVVTGAASGIGLALARRWARAGMSVAMADIDHRSLTAAVDDVKALGADVIGVPTDVSRAEDVEGLRDEAIRRFGRVNLLCNNAGIGGPCALISNQTRAAWDSVLGVNFYGLLNGIQTFLPHLLEHGEGYLVNTASAAGFVASTYLGPYTVSKHAAVALSEVLYNEIRASKWDVGLSVLCPGVTATRIADFDLERSPEALAGVALIGPSEAERRQAARTSAAIAAGRDPADVAEVVHQGVLEGRFYLFVDDSFDAGIHQRQECINSRTNPA